MRRDQAKKVLRAFLVSTYKAIPITDDAIDTVLSEMESRGMSLEPRMIDRVIRKKFPNFTRGEQQ